MPYILSIILPAHSRRAATPPSLPTCVCFLELANSAASSLDCSCYSVQNLVAGLSPLKAGAWLTAYNSIKLPPNIDLPELFFFHSVLFDLQSVGALNSSQLGGVLLFELTFSGVYPI